jgi:ectoine hydroxylase-related dioxygenase (phytanoyl-CoA dioxygenase family)
MMLSCKEPAWLSYSLEALDRSGYAIVTDVLDDAFLQRSRDAMYGARDRILEEVGAERLKRAGEIGTLRLLFNYDRHFFEYLEIPELLQMVDAALGKTAILHTQNGFILPSFTAAEQPQVFQNAFHRDFPRYLNGYVASISVLFALQPFDERNGATIVVPGTHKSATQPSDEFLSKNAVHARCPAGSMIVFDAMLWHAAGHNVSGADRLGINHQFTRSWIKQQIDYVRAVGEDRLKPLPERSRQLLGWYTRVVTSLDEYYRPEEERLYRRGQG